MHIIFCKCLAQYWAPLHVLGIFSISSIKWKSTLISHWDVLLASSRDAFILGSSIYMESEETPVSILLLDDSTISLCFFDLLPSGSCVSLVEPYCCIWEVLWGGLESYTSESKFSIKSPQLEICSSKCSFHQKIN